MNWLGNSLAVQWLELQASTAGGMGSIPGQGTKILQAPQPKKKKNYHSLKLSLKEEAPRLLLSLSSSQDTLIVILVKHYPSLKRAES